MLASCPTPLSATTSHTGFVPAPTSHPNATSGGFAVTVRSGVTSLLASLSPRYVPEHQRHSGTRAQSPAQDTVAVDPGNRGWTNSMTNLIRQVGLASKVASCWLPPVKVVSDTVTTLCSSLTLAHDCGKQILERREQSRVAEKTGQQSTVPGNLTVNGNTIAVPAVATATLIIMDRFAAAAAVPAPGEPGSAHAPIPVSNSATLDKIGQPGYPLDAYYRQTESFSHNSSVSIGDEKTPFRGHYNGDCHTISDLQSCLFNRLGRYAEVRDLRVANATINNSDQSTAALACEMEAKSTVRDVRIENVNINNGRRSCSAYEPCYAGVITGWQHTGSRIAGVEVHDSSVTTIGQYSHAAIGVAGVGGQIQGLTVTDSQVKTIGLRVRAAIGGGEVYGEVQDLSVARSKVSCEGEQANVGIGAGVVLGNINNLTVVKSQIETSGEGAYVGIGAGRLGSFSGPRESIEAGRSAVDGIVAVDSHVRVAGGNDNAGIGAGRVHDQLRSTTAINCSVSAVGEGGLVGIGAGLNMGNVAGTRAVDCRLTTRDGTNAGIGAGLNQARVNAEESDTRSLNSQVNGRLVNSGDITLPGLCQNADARLVTSDCQVNSEPLGNNVWNCSTTPLIPERGSVWDPIPINSSGIFNDIGQKPNYPANAHYYQTGNIDGSNLTNHENLVFSGHYDGKDHIIDNQEVCLFQNLHGVVENLHLVNARITTDGQPAAVVACNMDEAGRIEQTRVSNSSVFIDEGAPAAGGIIAGIQHSEQDRIGYVEVDNCTVTTVGNGQPAGIVAGEIRGQIEHATVKGSRVTTAGSHSAAGIGAGQVIGGTISHLTSVCNELATEGSKASAGIGVGEVQLQGSIGPVTAINSSVVTQGDNADAGVGVGHMFPVLGELRNLNALHCRASATGNRADAGIGVGSISATLIGEDTRVNGLTAVNSQAFAFGREGRADVAVGYATMPESVKYSDIKTLNAQINDQTFSDANITANTTLCASADQRFVSANCQVNPALSETCPLPPITWGAPGIVATLVSPTSTGLSAGAIAGITIGTVTGVALGAIAALGVYRYYHRQEDRDSRLPLHSLDD